MRDQELEAGTQDLRRELAEVEATNVRVRCDRIPVILYSGSAEADTLADELRPFACLPNRFGCHPVC